VRNPVNYLLAIDKKTGEVTFEYKLPDGLRPTAIPMTYMIGDEQYIVVAAGAGPPATRESHPEELVALTLP
jgi:glucose dehydrogenase